MTPDEQKLLSILKICLEDLVEWSNYASEYFQNKYRLKEDIRMYVDKIKHFDPTFTVYDEYLK